MTRRRNEKHTRTKHQTSVHNFPHLVSAQILVWKETHTHTHVANARFKYIYVYRTKKIVKKAQIEMIKPSHCVVNDEKEKEEKRNTSQIR